MSNELAAAVDAAAVAKERWFGGKGSRIDAVRLVGSLGPFGQEWLLAVSVSVEPRADEVYLLPVRLEDGRLVDARGPLFAQLARASLDGATLQGERLRFEGAAGPSAPVPHGGTVRPLGIDQSNTTLVLDERLVLKCYRRFDEGLHPEVELTRHLSERGVACLPAVRGSADVVLDDGRRGGALLVQDYVADGRDGWLAAEQELSGLLESHDVGAATHAPTAWASRVGAATGELHAWLATAVGAGFAPRNATREDAAALRTAAGAQLDEALRIVPPDVRVELADAAPALRKRFETFEHAPFLLTRVHGDLHIGQFLLREGGPPALVDFEGEPTKPAAERRRHASPLRDLAGLMRSIDHASQWVLQSHAGDGDASGSQVARAWRRSARAAIRSAYERVLDEHGRPFTVNDDLLAAFEAEKAVYEFIYAMRFLPSWLEVPRRALPSALD